MVEKVLAVSDAVDFLLLFWVKEWHQANLASRLIHLLLHFSDVVVLLDMYRYIESFFSFFLNCFLFKTSIYVVILFCVLS